MQSAPIDASSQPIKNWATDPAFYSDNTNTTTDGSFTSLGTAATFTRSLSAADAPFGMNRVRTDTLTSVGNYGRRWAFAQSVPLKVGDVMRISFWTKASFAARATLYLEFSNSVNGYSGAVGSGINLSLVPNTWTRITYTHTVTNNTHAYLRSIGNYSSSSPDGAIGDTTSHTGLIITINQPLPEVFCDGNTAGWKWLGTAGNSQSVGWPSMLQSIAGKPMTDLTGNNVIGTVSGDSYDPFTIYHVYDAFVPENSWTTLWTLYGANGVSGSWTTAGAMSFGRRGPLGDGTYLHSRFGTSAAANNQSAILPAAGPNRRGFTERRHVVSATVTFDDITAACTIMVDGLPDDTVSNLTRGNGIGRTGLKVRSGSASTEGGDTSANAMPIRTLYFPGAHSRSTRVKIAGWLATRYGTQFSA